MEPPTSRSRTAENTRPCFSQDAAERLAREHYGVSGEWLALPSERDQHWRLRTGQGDFVLKLSSAAERRDVLECQHAALDWIAARDPSLTCPRVLPTRSGALVQRVESASGSAHWLRLLSWLPGVPLVQVSPQTPELLEQAGCFVGRLARALAGFAHPAAERELDWAVERQPHVIRTHRGLVAGDERRALVDHFLAEFELRAAPRLAALERSVVHGDANDHNLLVEPPHVSGLIDFGDMVRSVSVAELAIAAAYAMLDKPDPLAAAAAVVRGYQQARPLEPAELEVLFPLICLRLCTSVCLSALQRGREPENAYLSVSERPAWALLERLRAVNPELAHYRLRGAAGLPPCPRSPAIADWLASRRSEFAPVLSQDLAQQPPLVFDLSVGSSELAGVDLTDMHALGRVLFGRMEREGAAVGLGRYDEPRRLYASDMFAGGAGPLEERRTLHLGIDLFAPAGSPVHAPLAGTVHSACDNAGALDYGPTIILRHEVADGLVFYTLYGHLSRESLRGLEPGRAVAKGERIAGIGALEVNGGWPPHLHFQVVADLVGCGGDFPGVARPSERELWLSLAPDPRALLGLADEKPDDAPREQAPRRAQLAGGERSQSVRALRQQHVGPSLRLSYRAPLEIVAGLGTRLYDPNGRAYLDCVNNVAHVGHGHPHVVDAVQRQVGLLNTNTRYLHERLGRYTQQLSARFPAPLRVCFLVNSGSEANDLALRLARAHTGGRDVLVLEGAYHGNLSSLIEISPYKYAGPGGRGPGPGVHALPIPDAYRGLYRRGEPALGQRYAESARERVALLESRGDRLAAFIAESLPSCAGQIVLPDGYLAEVYRHTRAAGGVCIADEVQVGFGRVGTHFWGFETQGVIPDIVTLGKPIGNGHPLGAVVTTAEIAASFDNGMEYFNTYGGNPVSCAAGLAVLEVVEREQLQARAERVGGRLRAGLEALAEQHALIGDVRGLGLFLGFELVQERSERTPAAAAASQLVERMRERGILLSTDGPLHNVIKIKPPLAFSDADADALLGALDETLREDAFRRA